MTEPNSIDFPIVPRSVWNTCVHNEQNFELVREAEQVSILEETHRNLMHVSVEFEGWFSCKAISTADYHAMTSEELMEFVSQNLRDLKAVMHRPG